jgi:hypothetical protein
VGAGEQFDATGEDQSGRVGRQFVRQGGEAVAQSVQGAGELRLDAGGVGGESFGGDGLGGEGEIVGRGGEG